MEQPISLIDVTIWLACFAAVLVFELIERHRK
jgi:hypothetical protein